MKNFKVTFIQRYEYSYIVESENEAEAKETAYDKFLNELHLMKQSSEIDGVEVEVLKDGSTTD